MGSEIQVLDGVSGFTVHTNNDVVWSIDCASRVKKGNGLTFGRWWLYKRQEGGELTEAIPFCLQDFDGAPGGDNDFV